MTDPEVWHPEPKPVPPELTDEYTHADYEPEPGRRPWASMQDRFDSATWSQLKAMSSGIGEPVND